MRDGGHGDARDTRGVDLVQEPEECCGSLDEIAPGREVVGAMRVQGPETQIGFAGMRFPGIEAEFGARRVVARQLARRMRLREPPVFARTHAGKVLIDPRTLLPGTEQPLNGDGNQWAILREMLPYLWPAGHSGLKARVVFALVALVERLMLPWYHSPERGRSWGGDT